MAKEQDKPSATKNPLRDWFPNPENIFAYQPPTKEELSKTAVFVLDTNVLLAPFLLSPQSVEDIKRIYLDLNKQNRLVTAAQAAREYGKNRGYKIAEIYTQLEQKRSTLPSVKTLSCPILEGLPEYQELEESRKELAAAKDKHEQCLTELKAKLADWTWGDNVSELYRTVFVNDHIIDHSLSDEALGDITQLRFAQKRPPGYKDSNKPDDGIGDVAIWFSILALGEKQKTSVVLVCNEQKHDWFYRSDGQTVLPRQELTQEFHDLTGRYFSILNWSQFLRLHQANEKTIEEAGVVVPDEFNECGWSTSPAISLRTLLNELRIFDRLLQGFLGEAGEDSSKKMLEATIQRIKRQSDSILTIVRLPSVWEAGRKIGLGSDLQNLWKSLVRFHSGSSVLLSSPDKQGGWGQALNELLHECTNTGELITRIESSILSAVLGSPVGT